MFRIAKVYGGERPGNLPVRGIVQQDGPKNRLFRVFFGDHGCSSVVGMVKYLRFLTGAAPLPNFGLIVFRIHVRNVAGQSFTGSPLANFPPVFRQWSLNSSTWLSGLGRCLSFAHARIVSSTLKSSTERIFCDVFLHIERFFRSEE